jgi:hypothetical protein
VLVEWTLMCELQAQGRLGYIVPILLGQLSSGHQAGEPLMTNFFTDTPPMKGALPTPLADHCCFIMGVVVLGNRVHVWPKHPHSLTPFARFAQVRTPRPCPTSA